jgi:hypothetical protein
VQDIEAVDSLRPFALEVKGAAAGEHARAGDDLGNGLAADLVELPRFLVGVVFQAVAPQLFLALEVVVVDVAGGANFAGVLVPLHLVGPEKHLVVFNPGGAVELVDAAVGLLFLGLEAPFVLRDGGRRRRLRTPGRRRRLRKERRCGG